MKNYELLCLLILFIFGSHAQDPPTDWNGDPKLCTVDPGPPGPIQGPYPIFPKQAEFTLERVEIKHIMDQTLPSELTLYQYLYDYDANKLILIKNSNGFIDVEYYYYELLKKSTYFRREFCVVSDIPTDMEMDGNSAINMGGTWHIRPLNEFLLFSSEDPRKPIVRPKYLGPDTVRGIRVDRWESCMINKTEMRTVKRVWSFAQKGFPMPMGPVGDIAVPVQATVSASVVFPNGTQAIEFDEIFNVHAYRPGIIESSDQLVPPRAVFCSTGDNQHLISLRQAGIEWPERFSVRVEATSSNSPIWQRFHMRYDSGRFSGANRIRYDYLPPNGEDFESVIFDFSDNLTYTIDRRVGSCKIVSGIQHPDVSPIRDPIGFFMRHENRFIFREERRIWEFNGNRACRHDSLRCASVTTSIDSFPVMIDPDTNKPNGEYWDATNMEYGWSVRAPLNRPPPGQQKHFDYPVYLYLRMYRHGSGSPSPFNIRTEDIEYEFYEMSHETNPYDFDTSICYRANDYHYLHLGFILNLSNGRLIDENHVDRRILERRLHYTLANIMQVKASRVSEIEVDHEHETNDVNVFFTLLGQTPRPGTPSGVADNEPTVEEARDRLRTAINDTTLKFTMNVTSQSEDTVEFTAKPRSLRSSRRFMSTHTVGEQKITEKYSKGAEAGAGIGGILVGLLLGVILAAVVRIVRKEPMPSLPSATSITNPLPNITYFNKKSTNDAKTTATSDA